MRKKNNIWLILAGALSGAVVAGLICIYFAVYSGEMSLIEPEDIVKMKERERVRKPNHATFIEVTITGAPNQTKIPTSLDIYYSRVVEYEFKKGDTIKSIIDSFVNGQFEPPQWDKPDFDDDNNNKYLTGLSIRNNEPRYIVFRLNCYNCQFAKNQLPFRVQRTKERFHFNPRVAWMSGSQVKHETKPDENAHAKTAYFIAHSDSDSDGKRFRTSFNIYVDMNTNKGDIPITIDPDVGYPGGNY